MVFCVAFIINHAYLSWMNGSTWHMPVSAKEKNEFDEKNRRNRKNSTICGPQNIQYDIISVSINYGFTYCMQKRYWNVRGCSYHITYYDYTKLFVETKWNEIDGCVPDWACILIYEYTNTNCTTIPNPEWVWVYVCLQHICD